MSLRSLLLGIVVALLFLACKDEVDVRPPLDAGEEYFPISPGSEWVYALDSIIFDDAQGGNSLDTFSRFIREVITDAYYDETTGDTIYLVERSIKENLQDSWNFNRNYGIIRNADEALRIEENQRFVKLNFPIREGKEWDALAYIDENQEVLIGTELIEMFVNWESEIIAVDQDDNIGGIPFEGNVLTCLHADDDNEIERRFVLEKYARGVGLIFRQDSIIDSRCKRLGSIEPCLEEDTSQDPPVFVSQPWIVKGEKGYILRQSLISYK